MASKPKTLEHICPRCGISDSKRPFVGERCAECALKEEQPRWPAELALTRCPRCERVWRGREWKRTAPTLIAAMVEEKMEKAGLEGHYRMEDGVWEGAFGKAKIPYQHMVRIAYQNQMCSDCEKGAGHYHEAIIQLRGDAARVERALKRITRRLEKKTFIARIEPMHGGIDIHVGAKKDVADALRAEGYKFRRTEKLVGQKEGQRLYRSTLLVRLKEGGE